MSNRTNIAALAETLAVIQASTTAMLLELASGEVPARAEGESVADLAILAHQLILAEARSSNGGLEFPAGNTLGDLVELDDASAQINMALAHHRRADRLEGATPQ